VDFSLDDDQKALAALAGEILGDRATPERLTSLERDGVWLDDDLWRRLADAGVVGAALSEDVGGGGVGFLELALLLEQVGAHVAPVPLLETVLCAALPLDVFGTPEQRRRDLPDVVAGHAVLTAALVETGRDDPRRPVTAAVADGDGFRLTGTKSAVPLAEHARRVLVPASLADGRIVVALVEPGATGVVLRAQTATHGRPQAEMELTDVAVGAADVLAGPDDGERVLGWLLDRTLAGLAATALGVSGRALTMSAQYTSTREQFGRPVATFQAVGHRLADAYVDVEAMRLTTLQAVWLLDGDRPATNEAAVAKWWAAEGGHRVAHAAQHVHGGVGIDLGYALARYFRWSKHLELALGAATVQTLRLGAALAAEPA
jgi:alkylation response protein AidB-like acyl-CoA dehydrogenase